MIKLFKVEGDSLYPLIKNGQRVVCFKRFPFSKIHLNDVVVFSKPPYGLMIKKVTDIQNNRYFVEGTDPMSIDSRNFGFIDASDIQYKLFPLFSKR